MKSRDSVKEVRAVVAALRRKAEVAQSAVAHPRAAELVLPDGTSAPASLKAWAEFDAHYPGPLSASCGEQPVAAKSGRVRCTPMKALLRKVCVDSVRDELEGDDEAIAYVKELAADFAAEMPGFGAIIEPEDHPDRLVWFAPSGAATLIWYEHDAFERREPFSRWLAELFEELI
jgi:hypothetical protein